MESKYEYENRSLNEAIRHMNEIEKAPLADRKEAAKEFFEAMRDDPALVAERLGWLIDGNYGYGEMMKAKQVLAMSKRANKVAALNQLVGAYEWQSPAAMTAASWKKLTPAQKDMLQRALEVVIEEAEREMREGG